ncbi:GNAT family N-acetyltransferase [Sporosarcina sp. P12(2017)]|uniref:GNAT family N-acetyltransferase n=1 Tax=unclassified Sporosarcina TaxID=2647733 RepID=UPI000C16DD82|nr:MULTISPECIES: GNAT family protein [unclassified Sporosarcina]PIC57965.1 GNAT family N-acetyltransferase [Sporosarcina sp. P10]PIC61348.1 GNAT family N-acetyltransferase [Sporosarcina sp. P12(2017)]
MILREIENSDAEKLSNLIQQVEASSEYMLWEAGEREIEDERQKKMIERMKDSNNFTILVAENKNNELVGYLFAIGVDAKRNKHSAYIVVGISENYRGQGVGSKLFKELEQWATQHSIRRLELTVVTGNQAGLSLYKKMGFEVEGIKRHSLFINDEFVDEYYMAKIISSVY